MSSLSISDTQSDDEYEVEKILNHRKWGKRTKYLVKWKNYDSSENTWEPEENLAGAQNALVEYWDSVNPKPVVKKEKKVEKIEKNENIPQKTDSQKPTQKADLPNLQQKTDSPSLQQKIDSSNQPQKTDLPKPTQKVDSPKPTQKACLPKPEEKTDLPNIQQKIDLPKPVQKNDSPKPTQAPVPVVMQQPNVQPPKESTETEKKENPQKDCFIILGARFVNGQIIWAIQKGDKTIEMTNEDLKTEYAEKLLAYYEDSIEFFEPIPVKVDNTCSFI